MNSGILLQQDPHAFNFIIAAGLTDITQINAVNALTKSLKVAGIFQKCIAIYPFVGGTSTTHKFNLCNPLDTDAAFRLSFVDVWTHNSNGVKSGGEGLATNAGNSYTYNGATMGYANTFIEMLTYLDKQNVHLSFYSRTQSYPYDARDMGGDYTGSYCSILARRSASANQALGTLGRDTGATYVVASNSNSQGFYQGSRTSSTSNKLWKNGSQLGSTNSGNNSGQAAYPSGQTITLSASSVSGTSTPAVVPTGRNYAYVSIGTGLTDTEMNNHYTIVQAYQTALSRNV